MFIELELSIPIEVALEVGEEEEMAEVGMLLISLIRLAAVDATLDCMLILGYQRSFVNWRALKESTRNFSS